MRLPLRLLSAFAVSVSLQACSKTNDVDIGAAGGPSPGSACAGDAECGDKLGCVLGVCRAACANDGECVGRACLGEGSRGGCALETETCGAIGSCSNSALVCGADKLCRTSCTAGCFLATQACLQGACVDATGCKPHEVRCVGATLEKCRQDGTGPAESQPCESQDLCEASKESQPLQCQAAACEQGQTRCGGGQTGVAAERCNAGRTGFDALPCTGAAPHCNPENGTCIAIAVDETEVTRQAYESFLLTQPATAGQPAGCAWNTSYEPEAACMAAPEVCGAGEPQGCANHPQPCVDWCDALAYCKSKGKRLCGRVGGGMVSMGEAANPGLSEWMNACSSGGQFDWVFGDAYKAQRCNDYAQEVNSTRPVGQYADCHAPAQAYAAPRDLLGNVAEWEDACQKAAEASGASGEDACLARGGSFAVTSASELACAALPAIPLRRKEVSPTVGFRCCGP